MRFQVFETEARSILSTTSGFIAEAGFTHSLTPARNCTFGCTYCYVPTMRIYAGLKRSDWERWGQYTTVKTNVAHLVSREIRGDEIIYCSSLVDPYQPAEESAQIMPGVINELIHRPPRVFVLQTRGPLILRDVSKLLALSRVCRLRVSFSITTNREEVSRLYEPHCPSIKERFETVRALRAAGIETYATLAPLLPCDPEQLAELAVDATGRDLIGDPLHVRESKPRGATTREAAYKIAGHQGHTDWFNPGYQKWITHRIAATAVAAGRKFATGVEGFRWLAQ